MTPLQINILLHYYCRPTDYQSDAEHHHAHSRAVSEAMEMFVREGLLKSEFGDIEWAINYAPFNEVYQRVVIEKPVFTVTDKARAMVDHLCAVKIPVCRWVQPEDIA